MNKTAKVQNSRVWTRLSATLRERIRGYCAASGIAERTVFEAALGQYIDGTSDMSLVMRRLDRHGRALARLHRDQEVLSVAFGEFVRLWFSQTPNLPDQERQGARTRAEGLYKTFTEHVAEQFGGGQRFIDDLPSETVANDMELDEILAKAARPLPDTNR
jgi:hypothetical protein